MNSEVFQALRDYDRLQGKCGICEYKTICGGCRARAFSAYGTMIQTCGSLVRPQDIEGELCAEDPLCPYQPMGGR
jgi:MoaA/NifB/PqqE/SkfB family radical SAM enzyme